MTLERQIAEVPENQISTKRGFPVYRTNPSVPQTNGLPTRTKRINVPGGKGSVIVDNTHRRVERHRRHGLLVGRGSRYHPLREAVPRRHQAGGGLVQNRHSGFRAGLSRNARQSRLATKSNSISTSPRITASATAPISAACVNCSKRNSSIAAQSTASFSSTSASCSTVTAWRS